MRQKQVLMQHAAEAPAIAACGIRTLFGEEKMRAIALLIVMTIAGCNQSEPESPNSIFEARIKEHGMAFEIDENGLYVFQVEGTTFTVNLENVAKDYQRDQDPDAIRRFADRLLADYNESTPDWQTVQPFIRFQLEPDDYADGFDGTLHSRVDDDLVKVFVYTPEDGSRITWISDDTVAGWGVSTDQVIATAERNMRKVTAESQIELKEIDGVTLGMISTEEFPFKASILLADNFRQLVEPQLGFPVYAVAPCRDFVFLIPHNNKDFLGRLGGVVKKEYHESGHSVTMDILEITDEGMSAIATFAPKNKNTEQGVAPQSATRSESDSDGGDKPQPESEPRPR